MGLTKNYKKAVNAVVFSEKTERFRITYKEVVGLFLQAVEN